MNDSGFDPNEEKSPEEKGPWEYGDSRPGTPEGDSAPRMDGGAEKPEKAGPAQNESVPREDSTESADQAGTPEPRADASSQDAPPEPSDKEPETAPLPREEADVPIGGSAAQDPPPYGQPPYGRQDGMAAGGFAGPQHENPYGQPYYWNYGAPYGPQEPRPPKKMGPGLRVFLWSLGVLAAALIVATAAYGIRASLGKSGAQSAASGASSAQQGGNSSAASAGGVIGGVRGDGTDPSGSGIRIQAHPKTGELSANAVYKKVIQSVVGVQTTVGQAGAQQSGTSEGTGIIASADGYILTNAHVVNYSRSNTVKVVLHNNKEYEAKVAGYDKTSDIAVLKINASGLSPAVFGSMDGMEVGDRVIAIGNPGGLGFAGSLTGGYISALDRSIEEHSENGMTYIQTDAAINPGNSGGPLVNLYGQVVGINSNKIIATGYEGMGFAIPVSRAKTIIDNLVEHGYVSGRTRLGILASTVQKGYTQLYGFPQGVLIRQVNADSALKGKAVQGDIITKADGTAVASMEDLYTVLNRHKPGDTIQMTIYSTTLSETAGGGKSGSSKEISVGLLEDKGETQ